MNRQLVAKAAHMLSENECYLNWGAHIDKKLHERGVSQDYSPHTTNIVIVRDPWTRAVSSFNDQIVRGYLPRNRTHSAFMYYLSHHAKLEYTHHTGSAARKCIGYPRARFDHVIDLEDISSFAKVARLVPAYGSLIEHGWERCTRGDARLYMPGSVATHKNQDADMRYRLCNRASISKVCETYREDYAVLARIGSPFACTCHTQVLGSTLTENSNVSADV